MRNLYLHTREGLVNFSVDKQCVVRAYGRKNGHLAHAICSYLTLLTDSPLRYTKGEKPRKVFHKFRQELLTDLKALVLSYSSLYDRIVKSTTLYGLGSVTGVFLAEMKSTPIFKEYLHWYKTGDPYVFQYITSFLLFLKKVDYYDETFHSTAFRGWMDIEDRIRQQRHFESKDLKIAVHYILRNFSGFTSPLGRYGPGYVSEKVRDQKEKSSIFSIDPKSFILVRSMGDEVARSLFPSEKLSDVMPVSRLKFVPKNLKTSRSICIEPNSVMYFQQMLLFSLEKFLHKEWKHIINLKDQSHNQRLGIIGSSNGQVDTVDLSAASDSVNIDLVRQVFPKKMLRYLLATRSSKVQLPDGTIYSLQKFAPMGSALCFPIQCILFLGVILCAYARWYNNILDSEDGELTKEDFEVMKFSSPYSSLSSFLCLPAVYGDDLVIDFRVTDMVVGHLNRLGFQVNNEKSYTGSCAFRETCGIYGWNGYDVSPIHYRVRASWRGGPAKRLQGLIDFINRCDDLSYTRLRKFLIRAQYRTGLPLAFTSDRTNSRCVFTNGVPYNSHLKSRFNRKLQRTEYRYPQVVSRKKKGEEEEILPNHESYLLGCWYTAADRKPDEGPVTDRTGDRFDLRESRVTWRWAPT